MGQQPVPLAGQRAAGLPLRQIALLALPDAVGSQPEIQRHALGPGQGKPRLRPLRQQRVQPPVQLRHQIIHVPRLRQPQRRVAVLHRQAAVRVALRRHPEPHALVPVDGLPAKAHQLVHVLAPPVRQRQRCAAGGVVGGVKGRVGGGVKVIVKMDAVHIVAAAQLIHTVRNVLPHLRVGRIQIQPAVRLPHPVRVDAGKVGGAQFGGQTARLQPVRVHPRLQRQPPGVGGLHQQRQRVKARILPLRAGAEMAEREVVTGVQRVPEGPHLRKHYAAARVPDVVQHDGNVRRKRLCGGKIHLLPFQIAHPHPKAAAGLLRRRAGCGGGCDCRLRQPARQPRQYQHSRQHCQTEDRSQHSAHCIAPLPQSTQENAKKTLPIGSFSAIMIQLPCGPLAQLVRAGGS